MARTRAGVALLTALMGLVGAACQPAGPVARSVEAELGLVHTTQTQGDNCFADFDGDGRSELLVLNHGESPAVVLRDPGSGAFQLATSFPTYDYHSCAPADFNRDGRLDVYLGAGGCEGLCAGYPKRLFMQQRDGTFVERAQQWGVTEPTGRGRDSAAFDADNDGDPDLFTGNDVPNPDATIPRPTPNRFFLNVRDDRGRRFEDATARFGLPTDRNEGGFCVTPGDLDGDGFTDVIVCGKQRTLVYRNVGGTGFVEDASSGIPPARQLSDAQLADLDRDGDLDLLSITWGNVFVRLNVGGRFPRDDYRLALGGGGADLAVGDVDGDGDADFYATIALGGTDADKPDKLMLNAGDGRTFTQLASPHAAAGSGDSAEILPDWRGRGGALIVVNNGRTEYDGPRQAIEVVVP